MSLALNTIKIQEDKINALEVETKRQNNEMQKLQKSQLKVLERLDRLEVDGKDHSPLLSNICIWKITQFNKEGIVDNVIIRDPGGYGFFIFND